MAEPEPSGADIGYISVTFERVLDQALNSRRISDALERSAGTLNREQLRTRALRERAAIAAVAAVEYHAYTESKALAAEQTGERDSNGNSISNSGSGGSGLLPVLAVFVPSLSAVAAAVFLVSGLALRVFGGRPYIGAGLLTAGFVAAAVAVGGAVADLACLLVAAAHNRSAVDDGVPAGEDAEVKRAREAWQLALLERGMMPFLLARLDEADTRDHV
ncbi:hypothetical protein HEP84_27535 [Streptomyces sp. RLB1-33]|uniref:hypothetical protein n=1 Tax=Streptomyces mirabilis TaxID=68239 RepID=UPI00143E128F|nr:MULTISPECIES: hypothetical protein [Streptomyces]QIY72339.1 hypothetical protein HEP84_27535 [Streptomyces sp. RLB1-33]QUW80712.1 hypothetical protein SMIR_17565 [Streptomyces mirabilis]